MIDNRSLRSGIKKMSLALLFGALIFLSKAFIPPPFDKMFIVLQSLLMALGRLMLGGAGATYIAMIGGFLTALLRPALAPFTFLFAALYGLLVDVFFFVFRVDDKQIDNVKTRSVVAAMALSTGLVGFISYYTTVFMFRLIGRNPILEVIILITGVLSGAIAGYLASILWNKHLKNIKFRS